MTELFNGVIIFLIYLIPLASIILLIRKFTKIPGELFRKILHFILLGAYIPLLFGFDTWWVCLIFVVSLAFFLFPTLFFIGKVPGFSSFVNERKKGEFKSSMLKAIGIMAFSITIGWGLIGDKYIVLASIYSWGVGDAFAALIGKKFGKHKITWRFVDNKKSIEGSIAMFITSALAILIVLLVRGGLNTLFIICISLIASTVSTFVELCSKNGTDTVSCPVMSMLIILPLIMVFGG